MRVLIGTIAAAAALASIAARAETPPPGIKYDCDTPANHFSELVLPLSGDNVSVTGTVELRAAATSENFLTLTRLGITDTARADSGWAGFQVIVPPDVDHDNPANLALATSFRPAGGQGEMAVIGITGNQPIPFELAYDGSQVTVTLGGAVRRFEFSAEAPAVRIVCSTGEFLFTDLRLDVAG